MNWKNQDLRKRIEPQRDARSTLSLTLTEPQRAQLLPFLEEIYLRGGSELRVDLPDNWIVFWKSRESESRLLLAHPQQGEWVTTVALDPEHGTRVAEKLKELHSGDTFSLAEQGAVGSVSNVDVLVGLS